MANRPALTVINCNRKGLKGKNIFQKFWNWLNEPHTLVIRLPHLVVTEEEKREAIRNYMTQFYAEYQLTSQISGMFPLLEAINYVNKLGDEGRIDAMYRKIQRKKRA